jgi:DNA-binding transcriptional LysR family regulator
MNVAQSAVSTQVKLLEDELGFQLFRRTGQGAEVTGLGRTFLQQAEHAVSYFLGLLETAQQLRGDRAGTLAIGVSSGITPYVLPVMVEALKAELARVRVEVVTAPTQRIHQLVAEERLDLGLTIETDQRGMPIGLLRRSVAELKLCLIVRPDHRLSQRRNIVDLEALTDEPLIMNELAAGYGELVLAMFADRGLRPTIAAVVDNVETIKILVRSGLGIAIVPRVSTGNEVRLRQLVAKSIRSVPAVSVTIVSRMQPRTRAAERNLEIIGAALQSKPGPVS